MTNLNNDLGLTEGEVIDSYLQDADGDIEIEPGRYEWHGDGLDTEGGSIVGLGDKGDVVFRHTEGSRRTFCHDGEAIENIVISGTSHEGKTGSYLYPGSTHEGVLLLDGADDIEGRGFYDGEGGDAESLIRNCLCSGAVNNGAYVDKHPKTVENSVFLNNNIANLRIGHFGDRGTPNPANQTTYVRNCLIGLTEDVRPNEEAGGAQNSRGLRIRHQGQYVIENCWFVYKEAEGATYAFSISDHVEGPVDVTFKNCHWHNDSEAYPILDKLEENTSVTLDNCTFSGSGDDSVHADADGSLEHVDTKTVPLPSSITGYPQADDAWGFDPEVVPFGDKEVSEPGNGDELPDDYEYDHTLEFSASPDNPTGDAVEGDFDATFTVDGPLSVPDSAGVTENDDGTSTVKVNNLPAGETRVYGYDGAMHSYVVDGGYSYTVTHNGTETTFDDVIDGTVNDGGDSEDGDETMSFEDIEEDVRQAAKEEAQEIVNNQNHYSEDDVRMIVAGMLTAHASELGHLNEEQAKEIADEAIESYVNEFLDSDSFSISF